MTKLTLILFLAMGISSCSRQAQKVSEKESTESSTLKKVSGSQTSDSTKAPPLAWEIYINKFVISPTNGCVLRSVTGLRNPNGKTTSKAECGDSGGLIYEASIEAPDDKENHYLITITHPIGGGRLSFTRDVIFTGEEIEFYRDAEWRIGIRSDTRPQDSDDVNPESKSK